ncbi:GNAT family N-acetyltransferase [Alkalicoccus daliensis]|uniref:Predicted acetyltransferase n=1 Tax=Alkalicoccus daliensis TaxID=745820 RepID=A0A1G9ZB61_9BACI|nr:GNAT family N-acetyltransferase [Alkalicoccus daliensis]SDN18355.1 Predicted acetyltransferase [Alkalicoccus daliensis]
MNPVLIQPTLYYQNAYLDFYEEWINSGEELAPSIIKYSPDKFEEMLAHLQEAAQEEKTPAGRVPHSTYWLAAEDKILGAVNIRHSLTKELRNTGGHIGYGIRPSERRKGYATELLRQALLKTNELGLKEVLVMCNSDNIGSKKTILHNGGAAEYDFIEPDATVINRFWIHRGNCTDQK